METYRVMAIMETGEETCLKSGFYSFDDADTWIEENSDNYPELRFFIESSRHDDFYLTDY